MNQAEQLWQQEEQTTTETIAQPHKIHPVDKKIHNIVKLLIIITLYYAIVFL